MCIWYGADIEISGKLPFKLGLDGWIPKKIGDISNLIKLSQNVDQFLSGVFFALPKDIGKLWNREFSTEDEPFRDIEDAILEIRAFDTTYFEIYSSNLEIIESLARYFSLEIISDKKDNT
jgi:hypothetical protein